MRILRGKTKALLLQTDELLLQTDELLLQTDELLLETDELLLQTPVSMWQCLFSAVYCHGKPILFSQVTLSRCVFLITKVSY